MYETFYGLAERPFSLLPDPEYLYLSPKHMRALTLLEYGMMSQAGFSVICGDTGAGKTTLLRRLLTELGDDTTVGLITNTHKSFGELLSWVLMAFGIDGENRSKAQMHQLLVEFLIDQYAQGRRTVLIVDEAQNMSADTLEELRMLSNINADKDQVLQVILAGQPALRDTLRKPELMQFAQRIAVDYYLESLNRDETHEYIQHRLEVAGGDPNTFTEAACHAIYNYSGGTPRLINLLCDTALVYGFAEQNHIIDAPLVEDVVREQHRNSIVPTFNKPLDAQQPQKIPMPRTQAATPAVDTPNPQTLAESLIAHEQQVATRHHKAAPDYTTAVHSSRADTHTSTPQPAEPLSFSKSGSDIAANEDTPAPNKVTRINKSASKKTRSAETATEAEQTETATTNEDKAEEPAAAPITPRTQATPTGSHVNATAPVTKAADTEAAAFVRAAAKAKAHSQPAQATAAQQTESAKSTVEPEPFVTEPDEPSTTYKDIYPIVHIAEEPKKNINLLILGFAGGMVLASIFMFTAAWMMFRGEAPAPAAASAPANQATPGIAAVEQAQLAIQHERDQAKAANEALQRELDAARMATQKQEAMRSAERRANEIISEQERRYSQEMERVRQRALDAEIAAAKARERERIANEEADRARYEASHAPVAPAPAAPAAPAPAVSSSPRPEVTKPAPANTKNVVEKSGGESQFSANPCNSPSAKFLSTCKK